MPLKQTCWEHSRRHRDDSARLQGLANLFELDGFLRHAASRQNRPWLPSETQTLRPISLLCLARGASAEVIVRMTPNLAGALIGTLVISNNSLNAAAEGRRATTARLPTVKILERMGTRAQQQALDEADQESKGGPPARKGLFTSGVVATHADRRIALFFSGNQNAGENLLDVLRRRAADLPPPSKCVMRCYTASPAKSGRP